MLSPNSRHLPDVRAEQGDCQWLLKNVGKHSKRSLEPKKHWDLGFPNQVWVRYLQNRDARQIKACGQFYSHQARTSLGITLTCPIGIAIPTHWDLNKKYEFLLQCHQILCLTKVMVWRQNGSRLSRRKKGHYLSTPKPRLCCYCLPPGSQQVLRSNKKYTKSHQIWTPVRLKIRKGRELGGNHDMWWPTSWPVSIEDDLFAGPPSS